jgi:threonine synthase
MRYLSTRGQAPERDFAGVLLAGLAEDGGLFMPATWPHFTHADLRALRGLPYPELAARVIAPFTEGSIGPAPLRAMCADAYAGFTHPAIVPLVQLGPDLWVQELFHGPTLAFKDLAMQLLGRLFDHVLSARDQRITILGATSGDTGSAAIEACRGSARVDIAILHPNGRTSEVQRRQMTTITDGNVRNIAVRGNFDDCQDLVKAAFADTRFREDVRLSAVNSINWARIAAQIPYYVSAALALGAPDREVAFAVPTGNFGNVLAAWAARRMGVPIARLIVASNHNDILTRFLTENDMSMLPVAPSLSPSMDIGVSSNFERLLFALLDDDASRTASIMTGFRHTGRMQVPPDAWQAARALFAGARLDDDGTLAEIRHTWRDSRYMADPHTATAIAAARALAPQAVPVIVAGTAHPAKFPDAVEAAIGIRPPLPPHLADLYDRPELFTEAGNDLDAIQAEIRTFASRNAA